MHILYLSHVPHMVVELKVKLSKPLAGCNFFGSELGEPRKESPGGGVRK
jgi:hypothetical protein